eukprot:9453976-Karenia_brevis.AAC.1
MNLGQVQLTENKAETGLCGISNFHGMAMPLLWIGRQTCPRTVYIRSWNCQLHEAAGNSGLEGRLQKSTPKSMPSSS